MRLKKITAEVVCGIMLMSSVWTGNIISYAEDDYLITIDESKFPDEEFRNYLLSNYEIYDGNKINPEVVTNISYYNVVGAYVDMWGESAPADIGEEKAIYDIKGIEYFTDLEELTLSYCYVSDLDLSKNTKLKNLSLNNNDNLEKLDLSNNIALEKISIQNNDNLEQLNLDYNTALTEISICSNKIGSINTENNTLLEKFSFLGPISSLDLSKNANLKTIFIHDTDGKLSDVDFKYNTELISFDIEADNISKIDLSNNKKIEKINIQGDKINDIIFPDTESLKQISLCRTDLKNIDLNNCKSLEFFSFSDNDNINSFDFSGNKDLTNISLELMPKLDSIDISDNSELSRLSVQNCNISDIDVSKNYNLTHLFLDNNQLTEIDVSNNPELMWLCIQQNKIKKLDLSNNANLWHIEIMGNPIRKIDLSSNPVFVTEPKATVNIDPTQSVEASFKIPHINVFVSDIIGTIDLSKVQNFVPKSLDNGLIYDTDSNTVKYEFDEKLVNQKNNLSARYLSMASFDESDEVTEDNYGVIVICYSPDLELFSYTGEEFASYQNCDFYRDEAGDTRCYDSTGAPVINEFKCDGTYTYYFQLDGTAMKDRLSYHPDGEHVIYFDAEGHEVFSDFANVKKTIAGEDVNDFCFFNVFGYMYVDVLTYDKTGTYLYYANPYGVMEMGKWFQFSDSVEWADGTPADGIAGGYGYANENGTLLTNTQTVDWEGRSCYLQGNGVAAY